MNKPIFILKNLCRMILLLICVSILAFALVSISPIDPLQANVGQTALGSLSPAQIEKLESYWGVGEPPVQRYLRWAGDFFQGNMGTSLLYRNSVSSIILKKLGNSFVMMFAAWLISGVLGLLLGIIAGTNKNKPVDKFIKGYALIISSTPGFWLALVLLMVFAVWLKVLPVGLSVPVGMEAGTVTLGDKIRHALLPGLTLSITGVSSIALHTREKMIDVLESDFILFARARGETTWPIVTRHALRNILLPALTLQFASISEIFGGSVLVEQIFSYPGLGQAAVTAGLGGDIPLLLGITVISAAIVFLGNFIANMLYPIIDPRIGASGGKEAS